MDDVGKLVLFHEVVDLGSFSAAAARRGLGHSTVSKHVRSLESDLGVRLLHRTSRSMALTPEGAVVAETSRQVGRLVGDLQERLAAMEGEVRGRLRVQALVHVGRHLVEPALARLLAAHPGLQVELVLDDGPLRFTEGGFDAAVRVGLDAEASLSARKLCDNDVCVVASPALAASLPDLTHPRDLAHCPTVAYQAGNLAITRWRYREGAEVHAVSVPPRLRASDGNALLRAVLAGVGVGYLSRFAAAQALADGRLVALLPEHRFPAYDPVYVLVAPGPRPARVAALIAALEAEVQGLPGGA